MARIKHIAWLFALLLFVAGCEGVVPGPEPGPVVPVDPVDPVDPTPTPTPTPQPEVDTILIGVCYSGMSKTTQGYYENCLKPCGAKPVFFKYYAMTDKEAEAYVASVDGIITPGSTAGDTTGRSTYENRVLRAALTAGKPILGICYGHQRINTVLGGTTTALATAYPNSEIIHKQKDGSNNVGLNSYAHFIRIDKNSVLYKLMGEKEIVWVNTSHEYSTTKPGLGVTFTAWADDGVVEALEAKGVLGVQFHPEVLYGKMKDSRFLPIFEYLVEMARDEKAANTGNN